MPLISIVFYSIPESYLLFSFGLIVIGEESSQKKLLLATLVSVFMSYLVRSLPLPFGIHTLIGLLIIYLLFKYLFHLSTKKALIASLLSLSTLLALENVILYLLELKLGITLSKLWDNDWLRTIIGWPHLAVWLLIIVFLKYKKIHLDI